MTWLLGLATIASLGGLAWATNTSGLGFGGTLGAGSSQGLTEPSDQALAAARRNVSIEMYSTTWCGACTAARSYMREHDIAFVDHDIEHDADAMARAHALNPRHSVPVLDIGGEVMIGFNAKVLEAKLDQAARKRVDL